MAAGITKTGQWDQWLSAIDPKAFEKRLTAEVRKATLQNALLVKKEIRARITGNRYTKNAPLTLAIKAPRTKPLVYGGDLFGAIAHEVVNAFTAFVGLNRQRVGAEAVNIGIVLHEGAIIPKVGDVTQAMRAAVFAKARKNKSGAAKLKAMSKEWRKTGGGPAKKWLLPARPFIKFVVEDQTIIDKCNANWSEAFRRALFGKG